MFKSCLKTASADLAGRQEGLLFPLGLARFQEIGQELSYFLTSGWELLDDLFDCLSRHSQLNHGLGLSGGLVLDLIDQF